MPKKVKNNREGWARRNIKRMLDQMGEPYPENATTRELKRIYRRSPNKHLIGQEESNNKAHKSADIFSRWKRQPGNFNG